MSKVLSLGSHLAYVHRERYIVEFHSVVVTAVSMSVFLSDVFVERQVGGVERVTKN
jgi:hypothetical protein